ncbi:peptidylprolyl isomerase [Marinicella sp. W31]|uniref:peptidylprolyl isomerase n=1 Tax=Marinicella sp. W31 TaxID=3023713 RepID=UPI0037563CB5
MKWIAIFSFFFSSVVHATVIRFETVLGDFDVQLYDEATPITVANFLSYVNGRSFNNSIIHVSIEDAYIQGGAFYYSPFNGASEMPVSIPRGESVTNERGIANIRGTLAMVVDQDNLDTVRADWFINLSDNSSDFDAIYPVFGEVIGDGMQVVDAIAALPVITTTIVAGGTEIENVPVINYNGGAVMRENFVIINEVSITDDPVNKNMVVNAGLNGAWFNPDSSSQGLFFEVLPTVQQVFLGWFTYDTQLPSIDATAVVGAAGQRWLSAQGSIEGNQVVMDVILTSNGLFNSAQETDRSEPGTYGTITVTFQDCANGRVDYDLPAAGQSGQFNIVRISTDNVALCEQLVVEVNTQ